MHNYRYFKEVISEEHMLYAKEIAELLGIYSINDKPATMFVCELLQDYQKENNIEQLYYIAKQTINKVYSHGVYGAAYLKLIKSLVDEDNMTYKNKIYSYKALSNKTYKFYLK